MQEENKLLEKANRQKVQEVEKLTHTISELEESILATGEVANAVNFYQNQAAKLNVRASNSDVGFNRLDIYDKYVKFSGGKEDP